MILPVNALSGGINAYGRAIHGLFSSAEGLARGFDGAPQQPAAVGDTNDGGSGPDIDQSADSPADDLVQGEIDLIAARAQAKAGIALTRASDEVLGSLLDTVA